MDPQIGIPKFTDGGENRCMRCQHCFAVCPTGALSIFGNTGGNAEKKHSEYPADEILNLIKCRRSFRSFRRENLAPEIIADLAEMLNWVPSGVNNHSMRPIIVDNIDAMDKIREKINSKLSRMMAENAPGSERFARYKNRILAGHDVIFRNAPHMIVAAVPDDAPCRAIDPVIALSYFELYAQSIGVATLWCGLAYWAFQLMPEVLTDLQLPPGYMPGYVMLFGKSNLKYFRSTLPKPLDVIRISHIN
jgi:nitroreductase